MFSIKQIPSERACKKLFTRIVMSRNVLCPYCNNKLLVSDKYYWCSSCRKKIRLKANTWLRGSNLSYRTILILLWCWQRKMTPGSTCSLSEVSYTTVARWNSKFRNQLPRDNKLLKGTVEIDEAFFGKRRHNNQEIVIGGIERETNRLRLAIIPDREQDSIEYFLYRNIDPESFLHTDCYTSYYDIWWNGYGHKLHNHSQGHFAGTNRIESVWSNLKRQIRRVYGQVKKYKLNELIKEWEARYNFKELFDNPITYLERTLVPH